MNNCAKSCSSRSFGRMLDFRPAQLTALAMSSTRTLAIIGASDEASAHIRLLLRISAPRLKQEWTLHEDENVDLVLLENPDEAATQATMARCESNGVPFAVLCEPNDIVLHGMALRRPITMGQVVALLNTVGGLRQDTELVTGEGTDFYNADLGEPSTVVEEPRGWEPSKFTHRNLGVPTAVVNDEGGIDAFELLVKGDPLAEPPPKDPLITDTTTLVARESGETARSRLQRDASDPNAASLISVSSLNVPAISLEPLGADAGVQKTADINTEEPVLPSLLHEGVQHSPVRLSANELPTVVLDPKARSAYSASPLQDLMPYATATAAQVDRSGIVGMELQRVRESQHAYSFDQLNWLFALAASRGRLNSKLDPGGSYAIVQPFAAAPELSAHARITAAMAMPTPLHEVAHASGARMEEVFDILNAYAAVNRIQYIPRQRLQGKSDNKSGLWGLFSRK